MKLVSQKKGAHNTNEAILTLHPQDKEDLFTLYNIINTDDEIIVTKKVTSKLDESGKKKSTNLTRLRLKIVSSEFEPQHEFLRFKGVTTADDNDRVNLDVPIGKFFSYTITYAYPLTLIKNDFNPYVSKLASK